MQQKKYIYFLFDLFKKSIRSCFEFLKQKLYSVHIYAIDWRTVSLQYPFSNFVLMWNCNVETYKFHKRMHWIWQAVLIWTYNNITVALMVRMYCRTFYLKVFTGTNLTWNVVWTHVLYKKKKNLNYSKTIICSISTLLKVV